MVIQNLKVQNVNKAFLFILLSFSCCNSIAQSSLDGLFCIDYKIKDFANCIKFSRDTSFEYHYSGDTGTIEYGDGEFKFVEKKLILNYNKTKPLKTSHHISSIWSNAKDSIQLSLSFYDFEDNPVPYVNVAYTDSLSKYGFSGIVADKNGKAILNLKKDISKLKIKVSNVSFLPYEFNLDNNYNYTISIYLQKDGVGMPIFNQIDTLEIVKIKPSYFSVKNKDGSIVKWVKVEN